MQINRKLFLATLALVVVSFIATLVLTWDHLRDEKINRFMTVDYMATLQRALGEFKEICGNFPTSLSALNGGPGACAKFEPQQYNVRTTNSWGNPFFYSSDGSNYTLKSSGESWIEATSDVKSHIVTKPR